MYLKKSDQKPLGSWVKRLLEQNAQRIYGVSLGLLFKRLSHFILVRFQVSESRFLTHTSFHQRPYQSA